MHAARPGLHESGCTGRRALAGAAVRAEAAPSGDRMATLTVGFHSVSTGLGLGCPHPNQHPDSIVVSSLTAGIHSVWSRRGSSDSHPNRRTRLIGCRHSPSKFTAFGVVAERAVHTVLAPLFERVPSLTIEIHSVWGRCGTGCPRPNRHRGSSACRCSPSKFTGFGVSAHGDIHTPTGVSARRSRHVAAWFPGALPGRRRALPLRRGPGELHRERVVRLRSGARRGRTDVWISCRRIDSRPCASGR